jgi:DNA polymerase
MTGESPEDDLLQLVSDFRRSVQRHARAGSWAALDRAIPRGGGAVAGRASSPSAEAAQYVERAGQGADDDGAVARPRLTVAEVRQELGECTRCKLHTTRQKIAFGVGPEDAALMFVGEAPGADEDRIGEPFVGRAGELLDKMIAAMGFAREQVYIANVLKCRPPGNRDPAPDEVSACAPFLAAQIAAVRPRIVVALGRPAANHLLGTDAPISALRGKFHEYRGIRVMPTFHPAFLLRQPDRKRDAWSDLKMVVAELARLGSR